MTTQVSREMTEQERQDVIERAGLAISKLDPANLDEGSWKVEAEAALEAVDHFTLRAKLDALVEAGDRLRSGMNGHDD